MYRPYNYDEIDIQRFGEAEIAFVEYAEAYGTLFEDVYISSKEYRGIGDVRLQITERVIDVQEDYESKYKFDFLEKKFNPNFNSITREINCDTISLRFTEVYDYNRAVILLKYADYLYDSGLVKRLFPKSNEDLFSRRLTYEETDPQKISTELFVHKGKFVSGCYCEEVRVPSLDWSDTYEVEINIEKHTLSFQAIDQWGIGRGKEITFESPFGPVVDRMRGKIAVSKYEMYFEDEYDYNLALLYLRYGDYLFEKRMKQR